MNKKMDPVVHFEMPYEERNRMIEFYAKAFGWDLETLGPEMGDYVVVNTTERDPVTKFPKMPGRINGGFFKRTKVNQHTGVVIAVDNIREAMKKVEESGGRIVGGQKLGEPDDIPGVGLYIAFVDTEGNRVSMIQPMGM